MPSIAEYFPGIKDGVVTFDGIDIGDLGDFLDSNGNVLLEFNSEASAVNYLRISNAATGNFPEIAARGTDGTIGININTKGVSDIHLNAGDERALSVLGVTDQVNYFEVSPSVASSPVKIASAGDDTNIGITLDPKGTGSVSIAAGATTTNALDIVGTALTTGKGIDLSDLDAITTGKALHIDATGTTHTTGILAHIDSAGTAMTGAGRLLLVDHTGATTTSGTVAEVLSAATDETVIFQAKASAALALGKVVNISGAAVTTGTLLSVADADALTTGKIAQFKSNSADTGTRTLVDIHNDNASATGVTPLKITQDNVTSTNFKLLITLGTISIYTSDETSPNTALTATKGSICLNGSATGQAFWNTDGATAWTALA